MLFDFICKHEELLNISFNACYARRDPGILFSLRLFVFNANLANK